MASVCKNCSNTKCQMNGEAFLKTCKEYVPMGVEERADKYAIKEICGNCNHCQSKGYIGCDTYRYGKNAYIAGAKENGVVWHKVADELPKNKGIFLFRDKYEKENRYINYGITDDKDFVKEFYEWTELPRYEG